MIQANRVGLKTRPYNTETLVAIGFPYRALQLIKRKSF